MKSKNASKRNAAARSSLARGSRLFWHFLCDDKEAVIEAVGGSTDGESGDLYYRAKQARRAGAYVWVEASSPELRINPRRSVVWPTREAAMTTMRRQHAAVMRDWRAHENGGHEPRLSPDDQKS